MHAFVWEYRLGQGSAGTAQLHNRLAAWRRCASSLRARQSSESWPATIEDYGGLLYYRDMLHCIRQILHWPKSLRYWSIIRYWPIGGHFNQWPWFSEYNRSKAFYIVQFSYILDSLVFWFILHLIFRVVFISCQDFYYNY